MIIQLGDKGPGVRAWQRIVHTAADSTFGPKMDAAVKAWQAARDIEPDGLIGPLTRAAVDPGDLIKPYEGLRLQTYDDHDSKPLTFVGGVWRRADGSTCIGVATIGWGDTAPPRRGVQTCTAEEANRWFASRLASEFVPAAIRAKSFATASMAVDAAWIAAATCCAYNCGAGWLARVAAAGFPQDMWMSRVRNSRGQVVAGLPERRAEEYALLMGTT